MAPSSVQLSSGWTFKRSDDESQDAWLTVEQVPTEVHLDLQKHGKIADPFLDMNELAARWVGEHSWTYRTTFQTPDDYGQQGMQTDLVFKGLDTFASVSLNEKPLLTSDNMFVEHRISLKGLLSQSGENTLEIVFDSARHRGIDLVKQHPEHRFIVHQTEVGRGPVRKAQYQWGWDWGPILNTCGLWQPVLLESYISRIEDCSVFYQLTPNLRKVDGHMHATIASEGHTPTKVRFVLGLGGEIAYQGEKTDFDAGEDGSKRTYSLDFDLSFPRLWWPHGFGDQYRYKLDVELLDESDNIIDSQSKHVGFRSAELVKDKDEFGESFYFRINNTDIFSGGSCWIPADSFLTRIDSQTYRDWIELLKDGNQAMIRVWGGGIYEPDVFYDACDEMGILVWQDFMFACASYPTYKEYLDSVEIEASQHVKRLRDHPSIIIWAGNNEDYQIVERYNLDYKFEDDKDPQSWLKSSWPARYIYEHLLPEVISKQSPGTIYHPSSPWGNGKSTTLKVDQTVGDVHQWNIWHGEMKPYQNAPNMGGRFVSEFGMEAYPHLETIESSITQPEQRYPGSMSMDFHNKAIGHERRLLTYVAENFQIKYDLPSFTHLTQVMQADAMSWAYKAWRRQWGKANARKCGGVLVWQLNDCWPTMSWAIVDYYLVKKPAFYAIKRVLEPITVGIARKFHDWAMGYANSTWQRDTGHLDPTKALTEVSYEVWVASSRNLPVKGNIVVRFISIKTGDDVRESVNLAVDIQPNGTTEVHQEDIPHPDGYDPAKPFYTSKADPYVIFASLIAGGKVISTDVSWPDPIKYLDFSKRGVQVEYTSNKKTVTITADKPVKGFIFSEKRGVKVSDNGFDLMPGEPKEVQVEGTPATLLQYTWVGA